MIRICFRKPTKSLYIIEIPSKYPLSTLQYYKNTKKAVLSHLNTPIIHPKLVVYVLFSSQLFICNEIFLAVAGPPIASFD